MGTLLARRSSATLSLLAKVFLDRPGIDFETHSDFCHVRGAVVFLGDVGLYEFVEGIASFGECLLCSVNSSLSDLDVCVGMVFSVYHYVADALFEFSEIARPVVALGKVGLYVCERFLG